MDKAVQLNRSFMLWQIRLKVTGSVYGILESQQTIFIAKNWILESQQTIFIAKNALTKQFNLIDLSYCDKYH